MVDWEKLYDENEDREIDSVSIHDQLNSLTVEERYGKRELISEGAMKLIYKCTDLATGRKVAFAVPKSKEEKFVESFLREARISASLEHPNIIPVYDVGVLGEESYFVMKLATGRTLADILFKSEEKMELQALIRFFVKVCEAVDYAHTRGVVHLDLKPENIQISEHGELMLVDWGLSKIVNWDTVNRDSFLEDDAFCKADILQSTLYGHIKGTPGYLSPEQAESGSTTLKGFASDIYSLGAIFYSILCCKVPVEGKNLEEVLDKTIKGELEAPRKIDPKISKSLEAICLKAMSSKVEDRYYSVKELLDEIHRYLAGFAPLAEKVSFQKQVQLAINRRPLFFASLLVSVICISLLLSYTNFLMGSLNNKLTDMNSKLTESYKELHVSHEELDQKKQQIESLISRFQKSQNKVESFEKTLSRQHLLNAEDQFVKDDFTAAIRSCDAALELDASLDQARIIKIKIAMSQLDFDKIKNLKNELKEVDPGLEKAMRSFQGLASSLGKKWTATEDKKSIRAAVIASSEMVKEIHTLAYAQVAKNICRTIIQGDYPQGMKINLIMRLLMYYNRIPNVRMGWHSRDIPGKRDTYLVELKNQKVMNISPLEGLDIHELILKSCSEIDFKSLHLRNLKKLYLDGTPFSLWASVHFNELTLPLLEDVTIKNTKLVTLEGFRGLNIRKLDLRYTGLRDFDFLASLPVLETLILEKHPENFPKEFDHLLKIQK